MNDLEIFQEILNRKLKGFMYHSEFRNIFHYINMNGLKRQQEYRFKQEHNSFRKVERYIIDEFGVFPVVKSNGIEINPLGVKKIIDRFKLDVKDKEKIIYTVFSEWLKWERETINFMKDCTLKLMCPVKKDYIIKMTKDTIDELEKLERQFIEFSDLEWELEDIIYIQKKWHDKYKKLCKKI